MLESVERYLGEADCSYRQGKLFIECDAPVAEKLTGHLFNPLKLYFNYPWEIYLNDRLIWHRNVVNILGRVYSQRMIFPMVKKNDRL